MSLLPRWLKRLFQNNTDEADRTFASAVPVPQLFNEEAESEQIVEFEGTEANQTNQVTTPQELEIFPEDPAIRKQWFLLTIRERQVVALVCMGYRNHDIASVLGVENTTIQTHLQNIFYKFGLRSRGEIRQALISWPAEEWWSYHHY